MIIDRAFLIEIVCLQSAADGNILAFFIPHFCEAAKQLIAHGHKVTSVALSISGCISPSSCGEVVVSSLPSRAIVRLVPSRVLVIVMLSVLLFPLAAFRRSADSLCNESAAPGGRTKSVLLHAQSCPL